MTATPVRDVDQIDMMREIAKMTGEYSEEELDEKEYLASEMNLLDAIREGLVVEPKIVTFNYTLKESDEYIETQRLYEKEKIQIRKKNLKKS